MTKSPLYQLKNVTKEVFDGNEKRLIINNISLEIHEDYFYGIKGKSGSGKSTLLNILGGMDEITEGNISFRGVSFSSKHKNRVNMAKFRRDIGFVFQSFQLIDQLSIYENVALPLKLRQVDSSKIKSRVIESLTKSGFMTSDYSKEWKGRLNQSPKNLSGGEKQRVAIARALITEPKVILADEPTGSLDSHNQQKILELLLKISELTPVILVSHSQEVIEKCSIIIEIEDGQILKNSSHSKILGKR